MLACPLAAFLRALAASEACCRRSMRARTKKPTHEKKRQTELARRALRCLRKYEMVRAGDRVGVAVSGGADSVALVFLLLELRDKLGIALSVAHFNHKLRGAASDADEKFVARLAAKQGLALHVGRADVAGRAKRDRANVEETARRARYGFFAQLVREGHVNGVAVAHTADDQAETVLAHVLRGTGLAGLGGIHPVAEHIVRPLIEMRRADLRAYLKSRKQTWREDVTNRDTARMRARIRKKLLPLLEKHFQPAVVAHLANLAELAREDETFLNSLTRKRAAKIFEKEGDAVRVSVEELTAPVQQEKFTTECAEVAEKKKQETRALSKRLVRCIVKEWKPRAGQLNAEHVQAVLELAEHGENGKSVPLPGGMEVRRERGTLVFRSSRGNASTKREPPKQYEHNIDMRFEPGAPQALVPVPSLGCVFRFRVIDWPAKRGETSETGPVLDRDTLRFPLVLRNWRPGDKLQPQGHRNAHKLKRLLNEKHISRWERDGWPVLTSGGVLAWARGFPVAAEFAASERTRAGIVIAEEPLS
jgi:tRNA(Ile)-lysidine synthase